MARDRKYIIPFPNGITVPLNEFTVAIKDRMLKFPAEYQPAIMSCLKVLARPETYKSDTPSELNYAVQQGHSILASVDTIPAQITDLFPVVGISSTGGGVSVSNNDPFTGDYEVYIAAFDDLDGSTSLDVEIKSHPNGLAAGGFCSIDMFYQPVASKAYVATGNTCVGTISDSGFATDGFHHWEWNNLKDVNIGISAIYGALFHILVSGEIQCGDI